MVTFQIDPNNLICIAIGLKSDGFYKAEKSTLKVPNAIGIVSNIRNRNEVKNIVDKTVKKFGRLDILVNNTGIFPKIKQS